MKQKSHVKYQVKRGYTLLQRFKTVCEEWSTQEYKNTPLSADLQ